MSAEHGFMKNVRRLVESGADSFAAEGHGWSPIDLAERGGHNSCFEFLKNAASSKEEARENIDQEELDDSEEQPFIMELEKMKQKAASERSSEQAAVSATNNRFGNSADKISSATKVTNSTSRSKGGDT